MQFVGHLPFSSSPGVLPFSLQCCFSEACSLFALSAPNFGYYGNSQETLCHYKITASHWFGVGGREEFIASHRFRVPGLGIDLAGDRAAFVL